MKKLILSLSLVLASCASFKKQDSQSINLNDKQALTLAKDMKQAISLNFSNNTEFNINNQLIFGKYLEQELRLLGYAINPKSTNNIIYFIRAKDNKVFLHLKIDKTNLSRIYEINNISIIPISSLTITK